MKETKGQFPLGIIMLTFILILGMYLYTYRTGNGMFWIFFVLERIISMTYDDQIEKVLEVPEEEVPAKSTIIWVMVFTGTSIAVFGYTLFKYPKLFIILIIGECIDALLKLVRKKFKRDK